MRRIKIRKERIVFILFLLTILTVINTVQICLLSKDVGGIEARQENIQSNISKLATAISFLKRYFGVSGNIKNDKTWI